MASLKPGILDSQIVRYTELTRMDLATGLRESEMGGVDQCLQIVLDGVGEG